MLKTTALAFAAIALSLVALWGRHTPRSEREDGKEVQEAALHRDVGDIRRPDMIRSLDRQAAEKIRKDRMFGIPLGGLLFLAIERLDSHQAHETSHVPAADAIASLAIFNRSSVVADHGREGVSLPGVASNATHVYSLHSKGRPLPALSDSSDASDARLPVLQVEQPVAGGRGGRIGSRRLGLLVRASDQDTMTQNLDASHFS